MLHRTVQFDVDLCLGEAEIPLRSPAVRIEHAEEGGGLDAHVHLVRVEVPPTRMQQIGQIAGAEAAIPAAEFVVAFVVLLVDDRPSVPHVELSGVKLNLL